MGQCVYSILRGPPSAANRWCSHQFVCDKCRDITALRPYSINLMSDRDVEARCRNAIDTAAKNACEEYLGALHVELLSIARTHANCVFSAILSTIIAGCHHIVTANASPLRTLDQQTIFLLIDVLSSIATIGLMSYEINQTTMEKFQKRVADWAIVDTATHVEREISSDTGRCELPTTPLVAAATATVNRPFQSHKFPVSQSHFLLWNIVYYSPRATSYWLQDKFSYTTECRLVRAFAAQVILFDAITECTCYFAIIPLDVIYTLARYLDRSCFAHQADYYGVLHRTHVCNHHCRTDGKAWSCEVFKCGQILRPPSVWKDVYSKIEVRWVQKYHTAATIGTYSYGMFEPVK